jgi:hypothetical protein
MTIKKNTTFTTQRNRYGHSCSIKLGLLFATDHVKGVIRWDGLEVTHCTLLWALVFHHSLYTLRRLHSRSTWVNYRPRWYRQDKDNWDDHSLGWLSRQNRETVKLKLPSRSCPLTMLSILCEASSTFIARTSLRIDSIVNQRGQINIKYITYE